MGTSLVDTYYPPPESQGGWRCLEDDGDVRSTGGMDPERLDRVLEGQHHLWGGDSWAIVVVRGGYLVREAYTFNVLVPTRFDIWSGTMPTQTWDVHRHSLGFTPRRQPLRPAACPRAG